MYHACIFRGRAVFHSNRRHPKARCSRWIRVSSLFTQLMLKVLPVYRSPFEFSLIVLLSFNDTWQKWQPTDSSDLILLKFKIYLHFSGMCILFLLASDFLSAILISRRTVRRASRWKPCPRKHTCRHRNHVRITPGTEVRGGLQLFIRIEWQLKLIPILFSYVRVRYR